jgi:hypothetical protein
MVELREEVTRVWATAAIAGAHAAYAKRMAQEKAALLATAHGEADEVTQKVSIL